MSGLANVSIHDMNRMAIYCESRNNSSVLARQIAVCKRTFTAEELVDRGWKHPYRTRRRAKGRDSRQETRTIIQASEDDEITQSLKYISRKRLKRL